jgi:hypothetical protein
MRQAGWLQPIPSSSLGDIFEASGPPDDIGARCGIRLTTFAFFALTTWRVTHLLVEEDGPADVVLRLRRSVGSSALGRLMDCFYCTSLWVALPLAVELTREPLVVPIGRGGATRRLISPARVVTWFALSGAACLLERATEPSDTGETVDALEVSPQGWTVATETCRLVAESVA